MSDHLAATVEQLRAELRLAQQRESAAQHGTEGEIRLETSVEWMATEGRGRLELEVGGVVSRKPAPTTDSVGAGLKLTSPTGDADNPPRPPLTSHAGDAATPPAEEPSPVPPAPSRLITLAVTDTRIGMTEEQLGRLFEAFSPAEASTRSQFDGTGFGQGSTFTISLPTHVEVQHDLGV